MLLGTGGTNIDEHRRECANYHRSHKIPQVISTVVIGRPIPSCASLLTDPTKSTALLATSTRSGFTSHSESRSI